jgi:hypothetical protein
VPAVTAIEARAIAQALDLDVDEVGICHACLSFVSFPLEAGNDGEVRRALAFFTPVLWEEGLERPARDALDRACRAGVAHAEAAAADVAARGPRSPVVRELVLRLAADLTERTGLELARLGFKPFPRLH